MGNRQFHFGYLFTSLTSSECQHCNICPPSGSDVNALGSSNEVDEREMANALDKIVLATDTFKDKEHTVLVSDLI